MHKKHQVKAKAEEVEKNEWKSVDEQNAWKKKLKPKPTQYNVGESMYNRGLLIMARKDKFNIVNKKHLDEEESNECTFKPNIDKTAH
jgi:hypothetical protein